MNRSLASRLLVVTCTLCVTVPHLFAQAGTEADASRSTGQSRRSTLRTGPVTVPTAVTAAATRDGRVRIIIGLSVAFAPEGLLQAAERVRQRRDIAMAQAALEAALAAFQLLDIKRFRIIPAMAATVDAAALDAIARRSEVAYLAGC